MTQRTGVEKLVQEFLEWRNADTEFQLDDTTNKPRIFKTDDEEPFRCLDSANDVVHLLDYFVTASDKTPLILECFGTAIRYDFTDEQQPKLGTPVRVHVVVALDGRHAASGAYLAGEESVALVEYGLGQLGFAQEIGRRLHEQGRDHASCELCEHVDEDDDTPEYEIKCADCGFQVKDDDWAEQAPGFRLCYICSGYRRVHAYLDDNNYDSIEAWAIDSDYRYNKAEDLWRDQEGNTVDLDIKLIEMLDAQSTQEDSNGNV